MGGLVLGTIAGFAVAVAAPASAASPSPVQQPTAGTVNAGALPTAQIDGVAWSQAIAGGTVYVGGKFTTARPAGAAVNTQTVPRANLMAYTLSTGVMTSFAPVLNNQVYAVAATPDGSKVYVAGQFTSVDGITRNRIAGFDAATGALLTSFAPSLNYIVKSLAVTNTTVYAGGSFVSVGSATRNRAAAFDATTGALLPWDPNVDNTVQAMTVAPDGSSVYLGGAFKTVGSTATKGLAKVDATTGAFQNWAAATQVGDSGTKSAILGLTHDDTNVYGSGYVYGGATDGNLEGVFASNLATGALTWVQDCHGDTYGVYATGAAVYSVGHAHDCARVGGFPETNPRSYRYALSWTPNATGTLNPWTSGGSYHNWGGTPSPTMQNWFPELTPGNATGDGQAAWNVSGNSQYVLLAGEFMTVNGVGQQGLTRFALNSVAKSTSGPRLGLGAWTPTATPLSAGNVRVTIPTNWDRDDLTLNYQLLRNGDVSTPVASKTASATYWAPTTVTFVDTGLAPGAKVSYQIRAVDPDGNVAYSAVASATVASGTPGSSSAYSSAVQADSPSDYWRLDETSGTTAYDTAGALDLTVGSGVSGSQTGAINGDADTAAAFDGTSSGMASTRTAIAGPNTFTEEAWVKTTTKAGGKIVGFGSSSTGNSGSYDRHIYMDTAGRLYFGVYNGSTTTVATSKSFNDGQWHQVVGSLSSAGMAFYVDGVLIGRNTAVTAGQAYNGYWRIGGDSSWSGNAYLNGTIDEVAIYPTALSLSQVQNHYVQSGRSLTGVNQAPAARATATTSGLVASFDGSGSSDPDGTISSYAWTFGDNTSGTGATPQHTYAAAGTYTATLTVTDNGGATASTTVAVTVKANNQQPQPQFTTSVNNLALAVDGRGSTDPDGQVTAWSWTFGDGGTATGSTASHTYAAAGTYTVTLTVTDNSAASASTSTAVTVTAPATPTAIAADQFARTVSSGWGTADVGGAWTVGGGASSVTGGRGALALGKGATGSAELKGVSATDTDSTTTVSLDVAPSGGGVMMFLAARHQGSSDYRMRAKALADGTVQVSVSKVVNGTDTMLSITNVAGLTYTAGMQLRLRLQVFGTSTVTINAKAWNAAVAEPSAWQATGTDTTTLLPAGDVWTSAYVSGSSTATTTTYSVSNLSVVSYGG